MEHNNRHSYSSVDDCRLINLQVYPDEKGKLAVVENGVELPFAMKRMFFLYDVPSEAERGGHSHYVEQQFIMVVTGSFDVIVDDGVERRSYHLSKPGVGLYIPSGIWRELKNFTSGAVCVVLSSINYCEADYLSDYDQFLEATSSKRSR